MNERNKLTLELLKNTFTNFILYTIIFTLFSGFLYWQVNTYLYSTSDSSISIAKKEWIKSKQMQEIEALRQEALDSEKNDSSDSNTKESDDNNKSNHIINNMKETVDSVKKLGISNVRVIAIERSADGSIKMNSFINDAYLQYFSNINFDEEKLDQIYEISINGEYYFRAMNVKYVTTDGETIYVQLLVNVDSEKEMMATFSKSLITGSIIMIVIILFATYILTRKSMAPMVENYEKQVEFVQNASHELRTPLTIIQAKQEMLLQSPNSKIIDKSEDIAMTLNETRRITKLVKELMDLARADASKEHLSRELLDLNELIVDVSKPYIEMSKMQNKKMNLELNCLKECSADRNKIKQLIVILLDNALKYTEENDEITISTRNKDDKCFIEVKDTGIGISDEAIKHVFERFYREDKARSREKGGSGLGLSIAQTIVRMHGGNIRAMHNNPKGTIFIVRL